MTHTDERIDLYIEKSAPFAQAILHRLRKLIHTACPQVMETMKWSFPVFEYKGMLCNMAAFKQHCSFGFWKGALLPDPHNILTTTGETAMGHFGKIKSMEDLPTDEIMIQYIIEALKLNEDGTKVPKKQAMNETKELEIPDYFNDALSKVPAALEVFMNFSYSNKKEYVEWITEAKTEATRAKRMETALEWMAEGKIRNWKYVK